MIYPPPNAVVAETHVPSTLSPEWGPMKSFWCAGKDGSGLGFATGGITHIPRPGRRGGDGREFSISILISDGMRTAGFPETIPTESNLVQESAI